MFRVGVIEAATGLPQRALIAVRRHAARILYHARQVQQVPGHEGGVAIGKIVLRAAGACVEIGRAWSRLAVILVSGVIVLVGALLPESAIARLFNLPFA